MTRPRCYKIGCGKIAEWQIWHTPETPDSYTETCTEHVGELLTDSPERKIYPIKSKTENGTLPDEAEYWRHRP